MKVQRAIVHDPLFIRVGLFRPTSLQR